MSTTLTNGRQRKNLAEQIDRLDSVLDGLSEGLNEAVAAAVKEAVRAVLTEVLSNPELLARLQPAPAIAVPEPSRPSRWLARAWDGVRSALRWSTEKVCAGWLRLGQACGSVRDQVAETTRRCRANSVRLLIAGGRLLLRSRWIIGPVLTAATLAGLTAVAGYHLGPWMAAGVSGAGSLGTALATPAPRSWFRWAWPWRAVAE